MRIQLTKPAFLGGRYYEEGEIVELLDGTPAPKSAKVLTSVLEQAKAKVAPAKGKAEPEATAEEKAKEDALLTSAK